MGINTSVSLPSAYTPSSSPNLGVCMLYLCIMNRVKCIYNSDPFSPIFSCSTRASCRMYNGRPGRRAWAVLEQRQFKRGFVFVFVFVCLFVFQDGRHHGGWFVASRCPGTSSLFGDITPFLCPPCCVKIYVQRCVWGSACACSSRPGPEGDWAVCVHGWLEWSAVKLYPRCSAWTTLAPPRQLCLHWSPVHCRRQLNRPVTCSTH